MNGSKEAVTSRPTGLMHTWPHRNCGSMHKTCTGSRHTQMRSCDVITYACLFIYSCIYVCVCVCSVHLSQSDLHLAFETRSLTEPDSATVAFWWNPEICQSLLPGAETTDSHHCFQLLDGFSGCELGSSCLQSKFFVNRGIFPSFVFLMIACIWEIEALELVMQLIVERVFSMHEALNSIPSKHTHIGHVYIYIYI